MLVLLVALALAGHSGSQGTSSFVVDDAGAVAVRIELAEADLPDLCGVDLAHGDVSLQEARLARAVARGLPAWVVLTADGARRCAMQGAAHTRLGGGVVRLSATAVCTDARDLPATPHTLQVDWGLFAGTPLDHVSVARFVRQRTTIESGVAICR